jgi:polyisoprenoid-binding protein YceI
MRKTLALSTLCLLAAGAWSGIAQAAPVVYTLDPEHTFPSFEADHLGLSLWRGKFNRTEGKILLDKAAGVGNVELVVDVTSVDYGTELMNETARGEMLFDVARYPKARYKGQLEGFVDGAPTRVDGELTLHGVTRPVVLKINSFKCMPHPMLKRDWCGADAETVINREDFGMAAGKDYGFKMEVLLRIQVEAVAAP